MDTPLRSSFAHLAKALGADEATVKKWADEFTARYTEPQRHYHTLDHIDAILQCLVQLRSSVRDETTMRLAIFFHDWIYDPKRKDNEIESIKCFMEFANELCLPGSLSSRVSGYIERTITHTLPTDDEADPDLTLFLDFDLEVLSRSDADYARYAEQIQAEYGHMKLVDYCAGRLKFLRTFLGRDRLYFSDVFYESFEQKARRNLEQEIASVQCKIRD